VNIVIDTLPATLVLDDGTTVTGGSISIDSAGTLEIKHDGGSGPDATLSDVSVADSNLLQVDAGAILALAAGTSITGAAGTVTTLGTGEIDSTGGSNSISVATLSLSNLKIAGGTLTLAASSTLT